MQGVAALSVNWGAWAGSGMAEKAGIERMERLGFGALQPAAGLLYAMKTSEKRSASVYARWALHIGASLPLAPTTAMRSGCTCQIQRLADYPTSLILCRNGGDGSDADKAGRGRRRPQAALKRLLVGQARRLSWLSKHPMMPHSSQSQ